MAHLSFSNSSAGSESSFDKSFSQLSQLSTQIQFPNLTFSKLDSNSFSCISVTRTAKTPLPFGCNRFDTFTSMQISENGHVSFSVLGKDMFNKKLSDTDLETKVIPLLENFNSNRFSLCTGYANDDFEELRTAVCASKSAYVYQDWPYSCVRSQGCSMWTDQRDVCEKCKRVWARLQDMKQNKTTEELKRKAEKRVHPSSKANTSKISPDSLDLRVQSQRNQLKYARHVVKKSCDRIQHLEEGIVISSRQSTQMFAFIESVKKQHPRIVEEVLNDPNVSPDARSRCRAAWERDQGHNQPSSKSNRWSIITIRLCLAIFTRSPKAYQDLNSYGLFSLPCVSTLRKYIAKNHRAAEGTSTTDDDLKQYYEQYQQRNEKAKRDGKLPGLMEGIVIFDETKLLSGKISYNTFSHEISGFTVDRSQLTSLKDLFDASEDVRPVADNMMLFIWRDITARFTMLGPFFFTSGTMNSSEVIQHLLDYVGSLANYGFRTNGIVCDGASVNQSVIKTLCNLDATLTTATTTIDAVDDFYEIDPSFVDPTDPHRRIYFIICPTHQCKNMINMLFKSGVSKNSEITRRFELDGTTFGVEALLDLYERQRRCREAGQITLKGLFKSYFFRDSWIKMSMSAARIFLTDRIIGELEGFVDETNDPCTRVTAQYLRACQKLFLHGILSRKRVRNMDSAVLQNISLRGYFDEWFTYVSHMADYTTDDERFLPQRTTFFLLRVMIYGFRGLCKQFFDRIGPQPDDYKKRYFISPLTVNGSAIESFFGQLRWQAGHALTPSSAISSYASLKIRDAIRASRIAEENVDAGYKSDPAINQIGGSENFSIESVNEEAEELESDNESDFDDWEIELCPV